jgi:hypothetical protein
MVEPPTRRRKSPPVTLAERRSASRAGRRARLSTAGVASPSAEFRRRLPDVMNGLVSRNGNIRKYPDARVPFVRMSGDSSPADDALPHGSKWAAMLTVRTGSALVQVVAFWAAIFLPFVYLPLLYGGLDGELWTFSGLLALNAVALVLGHDYRSD